MILQSWLGSIADDSDFSLQNIPFGVCSLKNDSSEAHRCVTALGDKVIDLNILQDAGAFADISSLDANAFSKETLNSFLSHSPEVWPQVRSRIIDLFAVGKNDLVESNPALQKASIFDSSDVKMHLPVEIGDYTDFYSSEQHAFNVGCLFRDPNNALLPNWKIDSELVIIGVILFLSPFM